MQQSITEFQIVEGRFPTSLIEIGFGGRVERLHRGRVLVAIHQLLEPIGAEPDHEVVAMRDHGNSDPTAQRAPLSKGFNVLCDVELLELTTVLLEPILGKFAIRSRGGGVNSDLGHRRLPRG